MKKQSSHAAQLLLLLCLLVTGRTFADGFDAGKFYRICCSADAGFVAGADGSSKIQVFAQSEDEAQQWSFVQVGDYYQLLNRGTGLALNDPTEGNVDANSTTTTQLDVVTPTTTSDAQLWSLVYQSDKAAWNIINKKNNRTFNLNGGTAKAGATIISWQSAPDGKNKTSAGRLWLINEVNDDAQQEYAYYHIVNANSGARVIDVETQNPSAGRGLVLYTNQGNNISQHWIVRKEGDYLMFLSRLGEWAINDPTEGSATATTNTGTQLNIAVADPTQDSQLWQFVELADHPGWGNIINKRTQHTLNVNGGTDADGTALISYKSEPTGGNLTSLNRRWKLVGVENNEEGYVNTRTDEQIQRLTDRPHIYVYTKDEVAIKDKKKWVEARIIYVDENDEVIEYNDLDIRARGNSTFSNGTAYKMPYRIRFDEAVSLLGAERACARNWTLMANAYDKTMMRNALTSELSDFVGLPWSPGAKFVDLSMNGFYAGTYQISDHMEAAPGRVELPDGTGTDVSYFLECDGYADHNVITTVKKGVSVRIHSPKDGLTSAQKSKVKSFMDNFETRLFGTYFKDPTKGYRAVVDSTTLADWYIADEVCANPDGFWSQYFYKKAGDQRLYFGPMWDYDIAYANDNRKGDTSQQLMKDVAYEHDHNGAWIVRMWEDPWFQRLIQRRYQELVDAGLQQFLLDKVDSLATVLDQTQALNYKKYGYRGEVLRQRLYHDNYADYVNDLKDFIKARIPYLTKAFAELQSDEDPIYEPATAIEVTTEKRHQPAAIFDITGRPVKATSKVPHGIYVDGGKKVVK